LQKRNSGDSLAVEPPGLGKNLEASGRLYSGRLPDALERPRTTKRTGPVVYIVVFKLNTKKTYNILLSLKLQGHFS
jgi:hypothetical protein